MERPRRKREKNCRLVKEAADLDAMVFSSFSMVQEVTHKLCETLSMVANIGVTHPEYIMVTRTLSIGSSGGDGSFKARGGHHSSKDSVAVVVGGEGDAPANSSANEEEGEKEGELGARVEVDMEQLTGGGGGEKGGGVKGEGGGGGGEEEERQNGDVGRKIQERGAGGMEPSASEELLQPTIQALAVLSNVRDHLIFQYRHSAVSIFRFWPTLLTVCSVAPRRTK